MSNYVSKGDEVLGEKVNRGIMLLENAIGRADAGESLEAVLPAIRGAFRLLSEGHEVRSKRALATRCATLEMDLAASMSRETGLEEELGELRVQIEALSARRLVESGGAMAWLAEHCHSAAVEINPHREAHEKPSEYLSDGRYDIDGEDVSTCDERDSLVTVQVYPDTSVGFIAVAHCDMDAALEAAIKAVGPR